MRPIAVILLLAMGAAQAWRIASPMPDSASHPARAPDLDFSPDSGDDAPPPSRARAPSRAWMYWVAAGTAAAAGCAGWVWYASRAEPAAVREERVFTDER